MNMMMTMIFTRMLLLLLLLLLMMMVTPAVVSGACCFVSGIGVVINRLLVTIRLWNFWSLSKEHMLVEGTVAQKGLGFD